MFDLSACSVNCISCTSATDCTDCDPGFWLSASGACEGKSNDIHYPSH